MSSNLPPRTLFEKVWDAHVMKPETPDAPAVVHIDLRLARARSAR